MYLSKDQFKSQQQIKLEINFYDMKMPSKIAGPQFSPTLHGMVTLPITLCRAWFIAVPPFVRVGLTKAGNQAKPLKYFFYIY